MLYAVSRGTYISGGFNLLVAPVNGLGSAGGDAYGAEQIIDAELGAKFSGSIADMPTRLDLALFNNWLTDAQHAAYAIIDGAPAVVTVNVPRTRKYGAEFDAQIKPQQFLSLGVNANYTHSSVADGTVFALDRESDVAGAILFPIAVQVRKRPGSGRWRGLGSIVRRLGRNFCRAVETVRAAGMSRRMQFSPTSHGSAGADHIPRKRY